MGHIWRMPTRRAWSASRDTSQERRGRGIRGMQRERLGGGGGGWGVRAWHLFEDDLHRLDVLAVPGGLEELRHVALG